MDEPSRGLPEQVALLERGAFDPVWKHRLCLDDPVMQLGETFMLNSQASPTRSPSAELVPRAAREHVAEWLREITRPEPVDVVPDALRPRLPDTDGYPGGLATLTFEELGFQFGLDLLGLPRAYAEWRLCVELYALVGRTLYVLADGVAGACRVLDDSELGIAYSKRLMPLLPEDLELEGPLLFGVTVPARGAALGGLRGYRWGLIAAGLALSTLSAADVSPDGMSWWWETEFFDDAASRVTGADGVERIPILVGALTSRREGDGS